MSAVSCDTDVYGRTIAQAFPSAFRGRVHVGVSSTKHASSGDLTPTAAREYAALLLAVADELDPPVDYWPTDTPKQAR